MIARTLLLAALLIGLCAWDRALACRSDSARTRATKGVGRMLSEAQLAELDMQEIPLKPSAQEDSDPPRGQAEKKTARIPWAIRLEWPDGRPGLTYALLGGMWRCIEAYMAPVDDRALDSLFQAITAGEGYVLTDDPSQAANYGIGTRETVRFLICGKEFRTDPSRDVQWSVDVGRSLPGGDGAFLRPQSSAAIWAVDRDPRAILEGGARPGVPPLLDPTLLTKAWLSRAGGITHIFIDRADGSALELATRPKELSEDELRQGAIPYEWVLDPSGEAVVVPAGRAMAFVYYLQAAGYRALLDPRRAEELGLAGPHDKLTLFPAGGDGKTPVEPVELHILAPVPGGGVPVANPLADTLLEVDPALAPLLLPTREELLDETAPNRWEAELDQGG